MRLPDDDELYEVDQTYLGPPRRYIGEMRYRTIFLFLVIAPLTLVLLRKLGMPITLLSVGLWLIGASYLSMKFADYISAESSAGAWLMTFVHELTTPRVEEKELYAAGAAETIRSTARPRGGWARALRKHAPPIAPRPGPPRVLEAKVIYPPKPAPLKAPAERRAIEAAPVSMRKPAAETPAPAQSVRRWTPPAAAERGGLDTRTSWPGRPEPAARRTHDNPWQGAAPWQARRAQEATPPEAPPPAEQERTAIRPRAAEQMRARLDGEAGSSDGGLDRLDHPAGQLDHPADHPAGQRPQSVQEYRRSLQEHDDDTHGGAE